VRDISIARALRHVGDGKIAAAVAASWRSSAPECGLRPGSAILVGGELLDAAGVAVLADRLLPQLPLLHPMLTKLLI